MSVKGKEINAWLNLLACYTDSHKENEQHESIKK